MARAVILGGGESGFGSAVLAKSKGFDTFLSDSGKIAEKYVTKLEEYGICYEQGGHTEELILNADVVIKSPGIPDKAPMVKALREKGVEIISEIEFAGRYTKGKTVCITGSNGKTTTTTLTHRIFVDAGYDVAVGGNIGESFAFTVATADKEWYVLELSSFQLDGCYSFRADTAVLMNITPDHLDRYEYKFQNYIDSKMRVIRNQSSADTFIYCADDPATMQEMAKITPPMQCVAFGKQYIDSDGMIHIEAAGRKMVLDSKQIQIKGLHNYYNVMAAASAALTAGIAAESIEKSVYSFEGVEHRLEKVATINGVEYINDSKATNVDSVWYALESMTKPTIWIAGGTDKGNDYEPLRGFVEQKVKALVCMGVDNKKLVDYFGGIVPVYDTNSLEEAMKACRTIATEGDTVLLSPACASFDLFKSYEDRGRKFKAAVLEENK